MSAVLGISGATRNACAAVCVNGQVLAASEQERLTRIRRVGLQPRSLPVEAVDEVLALAGCGRDDVAAYVVAEPQARLPAALPTIAFDHHEGHAATAFLTSPFERAAVLVCDSQSDRELSVWTGAEGRLTDRQWPWRGPAFATLYSACAEVFGFARHGEEHRFEALAHLGRTGPAGQLDRLFRYADGRLVVEADWRSGLRGMIENERRRSRSPAVETASALQRRLGEILLEVVADIRAAVDVETLCLGGGLFYNTCFTTLIRRAGIFEDVFVPINPGNAGLAIGTALMVARRNGHSPSAACVSPFLGPEYDAEAIKATLDGCKLSYSVVSEAEAVDAAVDALTRGQLVGWFQGRMEWGHRALGHRSILADPRSPYVLDNLNSFLRKRERSRPFGISVCEDTAPALLCGPPASRFMEYQYSPRDDRLRHVIPAGASSLRVQTVAPDAGPFWTLHRRMEQATGIGALVNTSFNGFHEPIVCSPRDAIRVFYGTGLDALIIGRFILRK
jgi:carbamoyltransferase